MQKTPKTELFRFVTLRAADTPTRVRSEQGFIRYEAAAAADNSALCYHSLVAAKTNDALNATEKLAAMRSAATTHLDSSAAFNTLVSAERVVPKLGTIMDWVRANRKKMSVATVQRDLLSLWAFPDPKRNEAVLARLQVWDTLLAMNILAKHSPALEYLELALRIFHLQANMTTESTPEMLSLWLNARIFLPNTVFPLPREIPSFEKPEIEEVEEVNPDPNKEKREKYEKVWEEVREYYAWQLELYTGRVYSVEEIGESGVAAYECITQTQAQSLSADAQAVLTELNIPYPIRTEWLITLLAKAIQKMSPKVPAAQKVYVMVNGKLIEKNAGANAKKGSANNAQTSPPLTWEDEMNAFYNELAIKPLGIADLRVVEQELCCYKPGEIAHIENVMKGEKKESSLRQFTQNTENFSTSSDKSSETQKDTSTSDRFSLQKEASTTAQNSLSFGAGFNLSGTYGVTTIGVNTNFAMSNSSQQSNSEAVNTAKDVTERSLKKVSERITEERSSKTLSELEQITRHTLDNTNGTGNVSAIYRWVNKYYKCRVRNYGKRMMMQFMIPFPAAFHLQAIQQKTETANGVTLIEPIDPTNYTGGGGLSSLSSPTDLNENNYYKWAAAYKITLPAPPTKFIRVSVGFAMDNLTSNHIAKNIEGLAIPDGYKSKTWVYNAQFEAINSGNAKGLTFHFGGDSGNYLIGSNAGQLATNVTPPPYYGPCPVPLQVLGVNIDAYTIGITITCERTAAFFEKWQIETYQKIMDAYSKQKAAFDQAVSAENAMQGNVIMGTNPLLNRDTEKDELKKWCLYYLYPHNPASPPDYPTFDSWAMQTWGQFPYIDIPTAKQDGQRVLFAESSFEWENIVYQFYAYYWNMYEKWIEAYNTQDNDPLFQKFLQAGYARVIVPVRPGHESDVLYYLMNGTLPPTANTAVESDEIAAILNEMQNVPENDSELEGETWEICLPTSLVVMQCDSGCIDEQGLPCNCSEEDSTLNFVSHSVGGGTGSTN